MNGMAEDRAIELSIVIPTRGSLTLRRCLECLAADVGASTARAEVVLVDDASLEPIPADLVGLGLPLRVVRNHERRGFGPAVNRGAREARGAVLAIVNDDVEVETGCMGALVEALRDRNVFAACPALGAIEPTGRDAGAAQRWVDESLYRLIWNRATLRTVPIPLGRSLEPHYPSGALMAVDRARFRGLGGFDERFAPYYWEDVDLGLRARARALAGESGWTLRHVPAARGIHRRHATVAREPRWIRKCIYRRNRELLLSRHLLDSRRRNRHLGALLARALLGLTRGDSSHAVGGAWALWEGVLAGFRRVSSDAIVDETSSELAIGGRDLPPWPRGALDDVLDGAGGDPRDSESPGSG